MGSMSLLRFGSAQAGLALWGPVLADLLALPPVAAGAVEDVVCEGPPAVHQNTRRRVLHVISADEEALLAVRAFHQERASSSGVSVCHATPGITSALMLSGRRRPTIARRWCASRKCPRRQFFAGAREPRG